MKQTRTPSAKTDAAATAQDIAEISERPVIYSHTNVNRIHRHFRNVTSNQIYSCAATGGVVGITGVNWLLGQAPSAAVICDHIEAVIQTVGAEHVAVGLDYLYDHQIVSALQLWPQLAQSPLKD